MDDYSRSDNDERHNLHLLLCEYPTAGFKDIV